MNPELHEGLTDGEAGSELVEGAQALGAAAETVAETSAEVLASQEQAPSPELREAAAALNEKAGEIADMLENANWENMTTKGRQELQVVLGGVMLIIGAVWFGEATAGNVGTVSGLPGGFGMAGQGFVRLRRAWAKVKYFKDKNFESEMKSSEV